jgi:hypothetical protein
MVLCIVWLILSEFTEITLHVVLQLSKSSGGFVCSSDVYLPHPLLLIVDAKF